MRSESEGGPRKVVVGTCMYAMWGDYPGLRARLEELGTLVDEMAQQARARYDRGLDLAALPEVAVSGGLPLGPEGGFPFAGEIHGYFGTKAREHRCYLLVLLLLKERNPHTGRQETFNAAVLLGRRGEVVGTYRKVHLVVMEDGSLEGGCVPGRNFPVFDCDFGKVGVQICWDMAYDEGWEVLRRKGAELVVWSTQSPGKVRAACRALRGRYYVLTSTWRNNASLVDPTGHLLYSITRPEERVLVAEIDLEFAILQWQPALRNGAALRERYGDRVDFRYSEAEDEGIFWSNDPATPIARMIRELELQPGDTKPEADRILQDKARGGPPDLN